MRTLLEECILSDPRWDHQIDHRADYYAQLILARRLPLTGLERGMRSEDPDSYLSFDESLSVLTMGALVRRSDKRAVDILRRYVSYGKNWHMAIEQFRVANRRDAWQGLDTVLERRYQSTDQLDDGWPYYVEHKEPPWSEWKIGEGPLGDWLRERERGEREHARESREERRAARQFALMTTAELLDYAARHESSHALTKELAKRTSPEDVDTLLAAVDAGPRESIVAALAALRESKDERVFDAAVRTIEAPHKRGRTLKQRMVITRPGRQAAFILLKSDPERTLPLARVWRSSPRHWLRHWGRLILERHATVDDIPWVRKQLRRRVTEHSIYKFCGIAEIVARFPDHGPFPQLVRLYHAFPYSFGRRSIVHALAVTSPDLAHDILIESLWDCESSVRAIACQHADLTAPGVPDRLRELAADPLEEENVRKAATARIE